MSQQERAGLPDTDLSTHMMSETPTLQIEKSSPTQPDMSDGTDSLDWSSMPEVSALNAGTDDPSTGARKLGITWQNLTIQGVGADASFNENVGSQFIPPQLHRGTAKPTLRTIVDQSHGCVKPGEMLLVLGRPGKSMAFNITP